MLVKELNLLHSERAVVVSTIVAVAVDAVEYVGIVRVMVIVA